MLWSEVPYLGPPDDNWTRGFVECRGLVLHIAEGSFDGTIAWMRNPASDVSSHFVIARDGRIAQMLDTGQTAWTQVAGNGHWVSVENEGFSTQGFTAEQAEANAQLYAWLLATHGVPAQLADSPSGSGLGWHGMGGVAWGNHPGCPGAINVAMRPDILARAVAINGGDDMLTAEQALIVWNTGWITQRLAENADPIVIPEHPATDTEPWYAPGATLPNALAQAIAAMAGSGGGSGPTLTEIAGAVRTELDSTKLAKS